MRDESYQEKKMRDEEDVEHDLNKVKLNRVTL